MCEDLGATMHNTLERCWLAKQKGVVCSSWTAEHIIECKCPSLSDPITYTVNHKIIIIIP